MRFLFPSAVVVSLILLQALTSDFATQAFDVVQLSLLALSLRHLLLIPWMTLIALVFSITTGILSIFLAFILRRHMNSLLEPVDVKKWFGTPANKHKRWKNVSFHAAFMMRIPTMLSVWSSGAFILGVGVHTVAHWALNAEAPNFDTADSSQDGCSSLGILVAYNVAMVLGLLLVLVPSILKYVQDAPLRQLDEATNPKKGRSKLDFESRFGDFEEYFKDSRELCKDFKEYCRNFRDTFRYFDELYADFEDIFWESIGEPGSSGTQVDEHSDILLNDSAIIFGNTLTHENTQTQRSFQEESRQRNNIAKEATQSDVEEGGKPGTGHASPEEGLGNSQGQSLSSTYGIHFKQPIPELMKLRIELIIQAEMRNIKRLQLMLRKEETVLPKKGTTLPKKSIMVLREETAVLREGTALLREETALLREETALLREETALLNEGTALLKEETALLKEAALLKEETNRYQGSAVSASVCASEGSSLPHQEFL